jgi:hypothetical protein
MCWQKDEEPIPYEALSLLLNPSDKRRKRKMEYKKLEYESQGIEWDEEKGEYVKLPIEAM